MPADPGGEITRKCAKRFGDFNYLRGKKLFGCDARLSSGDPLELAAAVHAYTCDRCMPKLGVTYLSSTNISSMNYTEYE